MKAAVLGAGSWGLALAGVLSMNGHQTVVWARSARIADEINRAHLSPHYLPDVMLPANLICTTHLKEALDEAALVVIAVPSDAVMEVLPTASSHMATDAIIAHAVKGFTFPEMQRISECIERTVADSTRRLCVIAGPSHAEEVARQMPTTIVVSAYAQATAETVQDMLMNRFLRVYTNPDVLGTELGGTLKNIIALGVGIADGLGFGDNAKAALMTRGLVEITRLGVLLGASPLTFSGLSGVGDLIATCTSQHSRNFRAGRLLGQGLDVTEVMSRIGMAVEGIRTTRAAYTLATQHQVAMPITEAIYGVLFAGKPPHDAVAELMGRARNHEIEEVAMADVSPKWRFT